MQNLAPIGISVYSRIVHLIKVIEALKRNTLAIDSDLYIFSDAPKIGDNEEVEKMRKYLYTINGFKNVYVIERKENCRIKNNRDGMKQLLEQYGCMIYLEEDIVTAPGFLSFMNEALVFYKNNNTILSITSYSSPFKIPKSYDYDVYLLQRFNAWGFATWNDRFDPYGFDIHDNGIDEFFSSKKNIMEFKKNGEDSYRMLLAEFNNELDALDVKITFYEYMNDMYTLYPSKPLVQNIGLDGSGVHCGVSDKFHHEKLWSKKDNFMFIDNISVDEKIRIEQYKFRQVNIRDKLSLFVNRFRNK